MSSAYHYLVGELTVESVEQTTALPVFSSHTFDFLKALSKTLLTNEKAIVHPELVALGFWLRAAHLSQLKLQIPRGLSKPLGCVVHYTPSNVDTMFVYSWACSLLMGNMNLVRVSNTDTVSKTILLELLKQLLLKPEYQVIAKRNGFLHYDYSLCDGEALSVVADARVIWGGDETVKAIRKLETKPRCRDICFADRFSACLINGEKLVNEEKVSELAKKLAKDIQPFSQQACSSPRVMFWLGNTDTQQTVFESLDACLDEGEVNARANQLATSQYFQAIGRATSPAFFKHICIQPIQSVEDVLVDGHNGQAHFLVMHINEIDQLTEQVNHKLQTLSVWGIDRQALLKLVEHPSITGIDRIVPIGQALDFAANWDGYELLSQLSRVVTLDTE